MCSLSIEIISPDLEVEQAWERTDILRDIQTSRAKIMRWKDRYFRRRRSELRIDRADRLEIQRAIAMCLGLQSFTNSDIGCSSLRIEVEVDDVVMSLAQDLDDDIDEPVQVVQRGMTVSGLSSRTRLSLRQGRILTHD